MNTHLIYLLPGIALLWLPRQYYPKWTKHFLYQGPKYVDPRADRQPGDLSVRPSEEFRKPRNYMDLIRGMIGGYLIMHMAFTLEAASNSRQMLAVQVLIIAVGVVLQTLRWKVRLTLFAPIFYLSGVAVGIAGLKSGLSATALTWVINAILPGPALFLFVQAMLVSLTSFFFGAPQKHMFAASALIAMPILIGVIARQRLSALSKKN